MHIHGSSETRTGPSPLSCLSFLSPPPPVPNIQPACIWGNNAHSSSKSFPRLFIWPMKFQRPIKMLCCYTVSCSFAHTRTSCSAWRVAGYLGNLSTKYLLVTAGTPDHNISGSQTAESSSLPPNSGNMIWEHVKDLLFFLWKVGNILTVALFFFLTAFFYPVLDIVWNPV